jgi:colicin import membrane protein
MEKRNTSGALIASVLLHGALVGIAFLMVAFVPDEKPPPAVFELVSLPNLPATFEESTEIAFEPLPIEPVVIPEPEPIPEPIPVPVEKKPEPKPEPKPPEKKPEPQPEKMSYEQFVREQGAPKVQKPREVTPKPIKVPKINASQIVNNLRDLMVDTDQLNQMSQSEINALDAYFAWLKQALKGAWAKPSGLSDRLQCVVEFDISSSGILSGVRIVTGSGNGDFDQSVLATFKAVRNFGPTPDGRGYPARVTYRMTD